MFSFSAHKIFLLRIKRLILLSVTSFHNKLWREEGTWFKTKSDVDIFNWIWRRRFSLFLFSAQRCKCYCIATWKESSQSKILCACTFSSCYYGRKLACWNQKKYRRFKWNWLMKLVNLSCGFIRLFFFLRFHKLLHKIFQKILCL